MGSGACEIINNVLAGNTAQQHGGSMSLFVAHGVTRSVLAGNLFVENRAGSEDGSGGGLMLNGECNVDMANNTFYGNRANDGGALGYYAEVAGNSLSIANDIHRSNTPNAITNMGAGGLSVTYSNIEGASGESWFGSGCIDADPLFVNANDPPGADGIYATIDDGLRLNSTSPSVDAGSNAAVPPLLTTDITGVNRILNETVDMGAYEYAGIPVPDIRANGHGTAITVSQTTPVSITVALNPDSLSGQDADWWVVASGPDGVIHHFDLSSGAMVQGLLPTHQGPLFSLGTTTLLNSYHFTLGTHTFYFGVDTEMNGLLDTDAIYYDWVGVNVIGP